MGDEGLEQSAQSSKKTGLSQTADAKSDAFSSDFGPIDADLAALIDAWPALPAAVRDMILALVHGTGQ